MRGSEGRRKVAIISEADRLQPQAANAFLKTLEEPPENSLLLLFSALPEVLPDTIVSRCITIPLAANGEEMNCLNARSWCNCCDHTAREKNWGVQQAYRVSSRNAGVARTKFASKSKRKTRKRSESEEARYRNSTDGAWLEDREEYYKALTESLYIQRRATLIEVLLECWSDVLRAGTKVGRRDLPAAKKETAAVAERFPRRKCCAGSSGWKNCATISAETSRSRSRSRWRFSKSSVLDALSGFQHFRVSVFATTKS